MIRLISTEDIKYVNEMYFALFKLNAEMEPLYHESTYQDKNFLNKVIGQEDSLVGFIYEQDNLVVGFAIAQLQTAPASNCFKELKSVYLIDIFVEEHYREHGFGSQLIGKIKDWGIHNKVDYMEFSVLAKNKKAYQLYLKEGFVPYNISLRSKLK